MCLLFSKRARSFPEFMKRYSYDSPSWPDHRNYVATNKKTRVVYALYFMSLSHTNPPSCELLDLLSVTFA